MEPRIAATTDNRFVLAWGRYHWESAGWVGDIYYAVRGADGGAVKGVTKFTSGVAGSKYYYDPALAALSGNRALLAYSGSDGISYAVLDSSGNVVKSATSIGYGWGPDAVQLSNGSIVVAWSGSSFAVLDSAYNLIAGPTTLNNPAAPTGDAYVSVVADAAGHAILTWMDSSWDYRRNLYYALVDGNGNILTPPMIFRTAGATTGSPYIETSYEGYGNTSYSWMPTSTNVDAWVQTPGLAGAPPAGAGSIPARLGNYGTRVATSVVLRAMLDSALTYVSAVPDPYSVSGSEIVWNLPDLGFLGLGEVLLRVQVPDAEIGTRYPVTWTLTSAGPEASPGDNMAITYVMVSRQVFLPLVMRNR